MEEKFTGYDDNGLLFICGVRPLIRKKYELVLKNGKKLIGTVTNLGMNKRKPEKTTIGIRSSGGGARLNMIDISSFKPINPEESVQPTITPERIVPLGSKEWTPEKFISFVCKDGFRELVLKFFKSCNVNEDKLYDAKFMADNVFEHMSHYLLTENYGVVAIEKMRDEEYANKAGYLKRYLAKEWTKSMSQ